VVNASKFETKSHKNQVIILAVYATFPNMSMLLPGTIALHFETSTVTVLLRAGLIFTL
jgi:hypothetical protein